MLECSAGNAAKEEGSAVDKNSPAINQLPKLSGTKPSERLELFARKLHACCNCYDFNDEDSEVAAKEIKLFYLQEIIDYIDVTKGVLTHEPIYALSVVMIGRNLFRAFAPKDLNYDPDEDDAIMDPAWPHIELVYHYFLHFLESQEFQPSIAKKYMDARFVTRLIYTFGSDDYRERNTLKSVLHRIYGKFLGHRATIRRQIHNIFLAYLYDNQDFSGVSEILEILGSIINGYVCPLKPEHLLFLNKVLIPLHTSKDLTYFQPQLVYCVVQYLEKDASMADLIIRGLLKFWPKTCSTKEVMFLGELEELVDVMQPVDFAKLQEKILRQLAKSTGSDHFQVAERALFFWDNEYFLSLVEVSAKLSFPIVLEGLQRVSQSHWNSSIRDLATSVLTTLEEINPTEFCDALGIPHKPAKTTKQKMWQKAAKMSVSRFKTKA